MKARPEVLKAIRKTRAALVVDRSKPEFRTKIKKYARSIDVVVYPRSATRALRLLKSILSLAYDIGVVPKISGSRYKLYYKDRIIKFHMREITKSGADRRWGISIPVGTGNLVFSMHPPAMHEYLICHPDDFVDWSDDEEGKLEKKIPDIVRAFPLMLDAQREKEEKEERENEIRMEKNRLWEIKEKKRNSAESNLTNTLRATRMWRISRELSEFLAEVESRLPRPYDFDADTWISLCRELIAQIDPFKGGSKPWREIVRADENGVPSAFISFEGIDPHDEILKVIKESAGRGGMY